jgi:hypothetical protein
MILCLDSIWLMRLKVVLTNGRMSTDVGFAVVSGTLFG